MMLEDELEMLSYGFARIYLPGGLLGTLVWQCTTCGAMVGEPGKHREWHAVTL